MYSFRKEQLEPSSTYGQDFIEACVANCIYDIDWEKNNAVWNKKNFRSVLSTVKEALAGFFISDLENGDAKLDHEYLSAKLLQIKTDPLSYVKVICRESTSVGTIGSFFVLSGGIDQEEANLIIDQALALNGHTRSELNLMLDLPKLATAAHQLMSPTSTFAEQTESLGTSLN